MVVTLKWRSQDERATLIACERLQDTAQSQLIVDAHNSKPCSVSTQRSLLMEFNAHKYRFRTHKLSSSRLTGSEFQLDVLRRHLDGLTGRLLVGEGRVLHHADVGLGEDDVARRTEARHHRVQVAVVVPERLPVKERKASDVRHRHTHTV